MTSDALRELMQQLEPEYPSLVLDIEPGHLYVTAFVYSPGCEGEPRYSVEVTTSVARELAPKASWMQIAGDSVELDAFTLALDGLDRGEPVLDPNLPPTATVHDIVDFILTEAKAGEPVIVKVGKAVWRVEA